MKSEKIRFYSVLAVILVVTFVFVACAPKAQETPVAEAPAQEAAQEEATEAPVQEEAPAAEFVPVKYEAPDCE